MKKTLKMPTLSADMKSGVLCAFLKEEGESFRKGEALFEVETEKVVSRVEAEEDGVMGAFLAEEGDELTPGAAVAEYEEA